LARDGVRRDAAGTSDDEAPGLLERYTAATGRTVDRTEYEDDRVTQVVLAIPDRPFEGVDLARDLRGQFLVYDGGPDAEMARATDSLARQAITVAGDRSAWPAREDWEEGPDPRQLPGLYDDAAGEPEDDEDDLEWTSLR
jgi:hypothetical protein